MLCSSSSHKAGQCPQTWPVHPVHVRAHVCVCVCVPEGDFQMQLAVLAMPTTACFKPRWSCVATGRGRLQTDWQNESGLGCLHVCLWPTVMNWWHNPSPPPPWHSVLPLTGCLVRISKLPRLQLEANISYRTLTAWRRAAMCLGVAKPRSTSSVPRRWITVWARSVVGCEI